MAAEYCRRCIKRLYGWFIPKATIVLPRSLLDIGGNPERGLDIMVSTMGPESLVCRVRNRQAQPRAWVLQGRMLSPRTLAFTQAQLSRIYTVNTDGVLTASFF